MKNKLTKICKGITCCIYSALLKLVKDIYNMFCGSDGRLSHRNVWAAIVGTVLLHICYLITWYEKPVHDIIIITLATMFLILLGLVTVQNIISIIKYKGGKRDE